MDGASPLLSPSHAAADTLASIWKSEGDVTPWPFIRQALVTGGASSGMVVSSVADEAGASVPPMSEMTITLPLEPIFTSRPATSASPPEPAAPSCSIWPAWPSISTNSTPASSWSLVYETSSALESLESATDSVRPMLTGGVDGASPLLSPSHAAADTSTSTSSNVEAAIPWPLPRHTAPSTGADSSTRVVSNVSDAAAGSVLVPEEKMTTVLLSPVCTSRPAASVAPPDPPLTLSGVWLPSRSTNSTPASSLSLV